MGRALLLGVGTFAAAWSGAACGDSAELPVAGDTDASVQGDGGTGDGTTPDVLMGDALHESTSGEGSTGDASCGGEVVSGDPVIINMLVIVDRSGSMNQTPAGFTETKWTTMVGALKSSLSGVQDKMSMGLLLFPDPGTPAADGCGMAGGDSVTVQIGDGAVTVPAIEEVLDDASSAPSGNTPTADALEQARRYFATGPGSQLEGDKVVLLALDGGPNCNPAETCDAASCTINVDRSASDPSKSACPIDPATCCGDGSVAELNKSCLDDTRTAAEVTALAQLGIPTFVVGIPGSNVYVDLLDALAEAGGQPASSTSPKYFQVNDPQQLTDTLVSITTSLVKSCEFQLASDPPNPDKVNVYIDGEVLPKDGPDGWEYDNSTSPPTIRIKGATCEELQTQGAGTVSFEFGCPTVK